VKFQFDADLEHQRDALRAVVDLFRGQPRLSGRFAAARREGALGMDRPDAVFGNEVTLTDEELLENLRRVQREGRLAESDSLGEARFTVEMETGTGKTYVYLRSLFALHERHGFRKFIIVVPSIAVREGVLKSISMLRDHLRALYRNVPFAHFAYGSSRLGEVAGFARDGGLRMMVVNIQAFNRDENIFNRRSDECGGYSPLELIRETRPMVVLDEPQSMGGEQSLGAIGRLGASAVFGYSATHRDSTNLIYSLNPVEAYDRRLVKRIAVSSVQTEGGESDAYVRFLEPRVGRSRPKARLEFLKRRRDGSVGKTRRIVALGDDLHLLSGGHFAYRDGWRVSDVNGMGGRWDVAFSGGRRLAQGEQTGSGGSRAIMREQIRETIRRHFAREEALRGAGVKGLSLLFLDRVSSYREHREDGSSAPGWMASFFEEEYERARAANPSLKMPPASAAHGGYFSKDKRSGRLKDTRGRSDIDRDTYALIMRDKERLLDPETPLRFIFTHTALREGWDNPNVFQICTLNESGSPVRKRQEIGRGLRLAVDGRGERVRDEEINTLLVVANSSYDEFARALQSELEEECGLVFGRMSPLDFTDLPHPGRGGSVGEEGSRRIHALLEEAGVIGRGGEIGPGFRPGDPGFAVPLPEGLEGLEDEVIERIRDRSLRRRIIDAREGRRVKFDREVLLHPEFQEMWDAISKRTRYEVSFDTERLVGEVAGGIRGSEALGRIRPARTTVERRAVRMDGGGVSDGGLVGSAAGEEHRPPRIPDVVAALQEETGLTRRTVSRILLEGGRLEGLLANPEAYRAEVSRLLREALADLLVGGIKYEEVEGSAWRASRLEPREGERLLRRREDIYEVRIRGKTLFDAVAVDSGTERRFARDLDGHENVRFFLKLPRWFAVETPVGAYSPDWAIATEGPNRLFLVRETKSTGDSGKWRPDEKRKVDCGRGHFGAIGVDYAVVSSVGELGELRESPPSEGGG